MTRLLLVASLLLGGCTWLTATPAADSGEATPSNPAEANLEADAAIVPRDDDGEMPQPDDPAARARSLRERFPGVRDLDLVKILASSGPRSGTCFAFMEPANRAEITATWRSRESDETIEVRGAEAVLDNGWTWVYQAPQGEGFELRASIEEIDVTYRNALRCICGEGSRRVEAEPIPVVLRLRWKEGEMPGVSAARLEDGTQTGLIPKLTTGHLVVFEFPLEGRFPKETRARCDARVSVSLLVDPPIL